MARLVCRICQKQYANYTCPRCNLRYCSLQCYKGHSVQCTEAFSRDNVLAEMKNVEVSKETKQNILQALQRQSEDGKESINDEEEETSISDETLQKLIAGAEVTVADLSLDELKAFKRAVASGELCHLIEPWEPWWLKPGAKSLTLGSQGNSLVQPLDSTSNDEQESTNEAPLPPSQALPPLSHLSKLDPSPLLPVHLIDLLYSYCFVMRLYNGEWKDSPLDAAMDLLATSRVLSQSAQPETVTEVIWYCSEAVCSPAFRHAGGSQLSLLLCDDTAALLRIGRPAVVRALADLQRMLEASIDESKKLKMVDTKKESKLLQAASRKAFFLMCWANQLGDGVACFAALVDTEKERRAESTESTVTTARTTMRTTRTTTKAVLSAAGD
ncbi:hypothetical protein SELMODRAFT_186341 [Selaginella moellendorffii]|uniref:HIT-type domain-containing protein n=1 Tax=Selaginella moellendorffii TaxID=88036 RepID=D8T862_SELML|nr:zinc finger HIT domain-containing protein 2 [Selaginella moellendorffii]EFJ07159.1 hypothetical protein SELMODRAFT_186341 [Selaginella moellendorffii]|eukprot:XP_002991755.1 zinc finger HIT domain-containing protein 2 [Selaginella moellendorffii]